MTEFVNTYNGRSTNTKVQPTKNTGIKPQPVAETDNATILWEIAKLTDRKIDANIPDITIKDHKNNWCSLYIKTCQLENLVKLQNIKILKLKLNEYAISNRN